MKPGSSLGMLKDKRVQLAAAAAVALGLFTLVRRGGGGGATIQPAAGLDTSASDLLSALTDLGQGWQQDLRDIKDRLPDKPEEGTGSNPRDRFTTMPIPQQAPRSPAPGTGSNPRDRWTPTPVPQQGPRATSRTVAARLPSRR